MSHNFDVVVKAGLSQTEFGALVGVGRVTVNLWMNGKTKPSKWVAERVTQTLEQLQRAVDAGTLPVKAGFRDAQRFAKIQDALDAVSAPTP